MSIKNRVFTLGNSIIINNGAGNGIFATQNITENMLLMTYVGVIATSFSSLDK